MITDQEFQAWLTDDHAKRIVLVEMQHSTGTVYLASSPFISEPTDTDPNRHYDDALLRTIGITARLDSHLSIGEIRVVDDGNEIHDSPGKYWSTLICQGYDIRFYIGAPFWPRDDFRLVSQAINGGITSSKRGVATFSAIDSRAKLSKPLQTSHLTNGSPKPIALGKPFNVKPTLKTDGNNPVYLLHEASINSASVRMNGGGAPYTPNWSSGEFTLSGNPTGNLTADPVEPNDTAEKIVKWVCNRFGLAYDSSNLAQLPKYELGLYYSTETQAKRVLDDVATSLNGFWRFGNDNKIQLLQLKAPDAQADFVITADDIVENGLNLIKVEQPYKKVTVNYKKNYSVVDTDSVSIIASSNPTLAKEMSEEYQAVTVENSVPDHPLAQNKVVATNITNKADANTEAVRLAQLRSVRREIWALDCFIAPAQVVIGQTIKLIHHKFGFANGKNARVISISKSFTKNRVQLEIWL